MYICPITNKQTNVSRVLTLAATVAWTLESVIWVLQAGYLQWTRQLVSAILSSLVSSGSMARCLTKLKVAHAYIPSNLTHYLFYEISFEMSRNCKHFKIRRSSDFFQPSLKVTFTSYMIPRCVKTDMDSRVGPLFAVQLSNCHKIAPRLPVCVRFHSYQLTSSWCWWRHVTCRSWRFGTFCARPDGAAIAAFRRTRYTVVLAQSLEQNKISPDIITVMST